MWMRLIQGEVTDVLGGGLLAGQLAISHLSKYFLRLLPSWHSVCFVSILSYFSFLAGRCHASMWSDAKMKGLSLSLTAKLPL